MQSGFELPLTTAERWSTILFDMDLLPLIALGIAAFVATNVDDSLLLLFFFGDRRFRARHVFVGQALGVGLLVLVSLVVAALALAVPERWVGLLGLLPVALGVKQLIQRRRDGTQDVAREPVMPQGKPGWRQAAAVTGVTLANGGDNIAVYVPLFAARSPLETTIILAVFPAMLALWTFGGYYLARRSALAGQLQRLSSALMPWVLIGLGLVILADSAS